MLAWKIAPALACGNTVVLKPAETTPLTALAFAEICQQADLPPGVVNIVTGGGETGRMLVEHPDVDKVAFTGSTEVGRAIAQVGRGHAEAAHAGAGRQGREHRLRRRADRPGGRGHRQRDLLQPGPRVLRRLPAAGAGVDRRRRCWTALKRRMAHAARRRPAGQEHRHRRDQLGGPAGADPGAVGGRRGRGRRALVAAVRAARRGGSGSPRRMFTGVSQAHRIAREEIFGPVLSVLTFRTPAEAVEKANNTPYGLSAGVWTDKGSRILAIADQLRAGVVWANTFNKFDPTSPFGGYKESGYGREGGRHGLEAYLAH